MLLRCSIVQVALRVDLCAEGHLLMMFTKDYEEIVSSDVASSSNNPHHADYIRSFPLPSRFFSWRSDCSPDAGMPAGFQEVHGRRRTVNILFAFVGRIMTLVAIDPSRLTRYHCMVLKRHWSQEDLAPGSKVCDIH